MVEPQTVQGSNYKSLVISRIMNVKYTISSEISHKELNLLYHSAWPSHKDMDFTQELNHTYYYICGYVEKQLIAFVKVIWDGGQHGFLLETTVHQDFQRLGIGHKILQKAIEVGKEKGLTWMHVDFEPHLTSFYRDAGFKHTEAGLIYLKDQI